MGLFDNAKSLMEAGKSAANKATEMAKNAAEASKDVSVGGVAGSVLNKIKQAKEEKEEAARQANAEKQELCDRVRSNPIFTQFSDETYDFLNNSESPALKWLVEEVPLEKINTSLHLFANATKFGLIGQYMYMGTDFDGKERYIMGYESFEVRVFSEMGKKDLPDDYDVLLAALDGMSSRLHELPYITLEKESISGVGPTLWLKMDKEKVAEMMNEVVEAGKEDW